MSYNIYYVLGVVLLVYLLITMANKRTARRRKSRKFMEGYNRNRAGGSRDKEPGEKEKKKAEK